MTFLRFTKKKNNINIKDSTYIYNIVIFIIFLFFITISALSIRDSYLKSSNIAGHEIAHKTFLMITKDIEKAAQSIKYIGYSLAKNTKKYNITENDTSNDAQILPILKNSREIMLASLDTPEEVDCYAAVGKRIIRDDKKHLDESIDASTRAWYKKAVNNIDKVNVTPPYVDIYSKKLAFTLSFSHDGKSVYAVDFYLKPKYDNWQKESSLGNYSFFLITPIGQILKYHSNMTITDAHMFIFHILKTIKFDPKSSTQLVPVTMPNGKTANFFFHYEPKYDMYCIVSLPYNTILKPFTNIIYFLFVIVFIFLIVEFFTLRREKNLKKEINTTQESFNVLGNSYALLLRFNVNTALFTVLKASHNAKTAFSNKRTYKDLIETLKNRLNASDFKVFSTKFSLEALKQMCQQKDSMVDISQDFLWKVPNRNEITWFNVRALYDNTTVSDEIIIAFKEITDEKIQELKEKQIIQESLERATTVEKEKTVFFSQISHDMRTPLNGITGICHLGKNKWAHNEKYLSYINKISNASEQLLTLVNDLLDISKNNVDTTLEKAPFSLTEAMQECITPFLELAKIQKKTIDLHLDLKHQTIIGDKAKFIQVINNLVSNSIKYSNEGAKVFIKVNEIITFNKTEFVIVIKDTGIGMSETYLKNLFIPYAREERKANVVGTGLGMPIVKNLVNKMDGTIKVKSELNKGTEFTITIPFKVCEENNSIKTTVKQDQNFSLKELNILVVEDNKLNMEILSEVLTLEGANVTKAYDGLEGIKAYMQEKDYFFDIILMDIKMPNMDGIHATMSIRNLPKADAKTIPIIAVTANAFTDDIDASKQAGMNAHLAKPINFAILKDTIKSLLDSSKDK